MIKKNILFVIIAILLFGCGPNKKDMNYIKDYMIQCSSDLIHLQLEKGIKTKDFNFQDNKFTLQIDTTGKPVFLIDSNYSNSMNINYNEHKYEVILNNAEIKVRPKE